MLKGKYMINPIIERFGMFTKKPITCLDSDNLFIKSGINIIGSLAGVGKTTYLQTMSEQWRNQGYEVAHFNCDCAPCYDKDMLNSPVNKEEFAELEQLLLKTAKPEDIFIFDSLKALSSYLGKDTESNPDMMTVMQSFRSIIAKTGCTFILVHHVFQNKLLKKPDAHLSGARAIEEQCDSGFIFKRDGSNMSAQIIKSRAGHARDSLITIG